MKNSLTWRVKSEILNFRKSEVIIISIALKIVHEWNGHLELFSCLQVIENSRLYMLL